MGIQAVLVLCIVHTICHASPYPPQTFFTNRALHAEKDGAEDDWRINGGEDASLNEFPYQVALTDRFGRLFCGATLINDRYVLTAGHCLYNKVAESIHVRLGEHDRSTDDETRHVVVEADRLISHPKFNMQTTFNDLGLIRLATSVQFSNEIRPACLSTTEFNGPTAIVSGWGATNIKGHAIDRLQKLELQILSYTECDEKLKGFRILLTPEKICGWQPYKDSCKGDSGGPLATVDKGERRTLVGIVSMGFQCGKTNMPGLYTRVSKYIDWIKQETRDASSICFA